MIRQYYTIKKLCNELECLLGCKVTDCFSQEKDTLHIGFYDGSNMKWLRISAASHNSAIYLDSTFARANKNTIDMFKTLPGDSLQNIRLLDGDRVIVFEFIRFNVYALIFGGADANVIFCNKHNKILHAIKENKAEPGTVFKPRDEKLPDFDLISDEMSLGKALTKSSLLLSREFAEELCFRLQYDINLPLSAFDDDQKAKIKYTAESIINECLSSNEYYMLKKSIAGKGIFSLIPLNNYEIRAKYDSISTGIKKVYVHNISEEKAGARHKEIMSLLANEQKKCANTLRACQDLETAQKRADQYRLWADLLMSAPNPKAKPGKKYYTYDYSGKSIEISLDSKLNLLDNAQKYYSKSKDTFEDIRIRKERKPKLEKKLEKINYYIAKAKESRFFKEIDRLGTEIRQELGLKMQKEDKTPTEKYKVFDLGEGYMLYVGKNAANNDELTMKFAKPNDMWFHARGSSGSHAVLRLESGAKLPKHILKKAAEISAYYSGARNAKYTPVCYTLKKNVRKPKGANVGAVVISKEEVIMAEPRLPEGETE